MPVITGAPQDWQYSAKPATVAPHFAQTREGVGITDPRSGALILRLANPRLSKDIIPLKYPGLLKVMTAMLATTPTDNARIVSDIHMGV